MSVAEHAESVEAAIGLLARAHRKALAEAKGQPESTWIDAACAIGAAEAQLLAAQPSALPGWPTKGRAGIPASACSRRPSSHWPGSPPARDPCRWRSSGPT
jgi:hypothetical protein